MRTLFFVWFFVISCGAAQAQNYNISIETEGLKPVEAAIAEQIKGFGTGEEFAECAYIGEPLGAGENLYFATTDKTCGWGAYLGPIWVIYQGENGPQVLFFTRGASLEALNKNSFPDF